MANTKKMRITLAALLLSQMTTFGQTAIPLVYDKECANDNFRVPEMPAIDKLPEITTLPDPFAGLMEAGVQQTSRIGNVIVLR